MPNYKRSRVGLPRGKTRPKSHVTYTQQVGSLVPQSTLKSVEINAIDRSTTDSQTTRQGNEIDVSGVRIMTYSRNPLALPIFLKMYVCTYVGQDSLTNPRISFPIQFLLTTFTVGKATLALPISMEFRGRALAVTSMI